MQTETGVCPGRLRSAEVRRLILYVNLLSVSVTTYSVVWILCAIYHHFIHDMLVSPTCVQLIIQKTLIVVIWIRKAHTQG